MWKLRKTSQDQQPFTHEELFVRRYDQLLNWALRLTNGDGQRAQDLVQDAFVQFTFARPDLDAIQNIDGYLYVMLRNLHLLDLRRVTNHQTRSLSLIDYDSAELGLRAVDQRMQIETQDELYRICHYACQRKKSSKAGSALILRYFHGYYPNEIALIIRASRAAVSELIRLARAEAKLFLENPSALSFIANTAVPQQVPTGYDQSSDKFLCNLSQMIFESRTGGCLSMANLKREYNSKEPVPIEAQRLEHIVCCIECLDRVNVILGLPLLAERSPVDSLGPDSRPKGGPGDSGGATGGGSGGVLNKLRRRARQVFEHSPQELCISVNGSIHVWQTISSVRSEQTVSLDETETVDLIDVTSEQGIRLFYLAIDQPESVPVKQSRLVHLSDHRTLQVTLDHTGLRPQLHVVYYDPGIAAQTDVELQQHESVAANSAVIAADEVVTGSGAVRSLPDTESRWRRFTDWSFWLRPGILTAVIAVVLIIVISTFVILHRSPSTTATSVLLNRAIVAELAFAPAPRQATHRTINFEEFGASGEPISHRRIEIWETNGAGLNAYIRTRRVFDENNRLVAGEWVKADGSGFVYDNGVKLAEQNDEQKSLSALLDANTVWRLDLSAKDFSGMIGQIDGVTVEDGTSSYALNYQTAGVGSTGSSGFRLIKASLTIDKGDLRATGMKITVGPLDKNSKPVEYAFTESGVERKSLSDVPAGVFEPDVDPVRSSLSKTRNDTEQSGRLAQVDPNPSLVASTELEILGRLNEINALSGDQVSLTRTSEGMLRVQGIVETQRRKSEFLRALASFKSNSFVRVEIQTAAEAARRQTRAGSGAISTGSVEVDKATIPADADIRTYLARTRGLSGASLDQEVHNFAERTLEQSRQARGRALALKQIAEQFSLEDLRSLDESSRSRWKAMLRTQAQRVQQELNRLSQNLQPIFSTGEAGELGSNVDISSDKDVVQACRHLFDLVRSTDEAVSRSFSIFTDGESTAPIKAKPFWRALGEGEKLSSKLAGGQ